MILSGGGNLQLHKQEVNDLNVFPVPDGDTGTNMGMTIGAAMAELGSIDGESAGKVASVCSNALLRGARGNSGVILSLLFRGMSKSIGKAEEIDAKQFAAAFKCGVEAAYKAVMKPTEGTILTVTRLAGDAAMAAAEGGADVLKTVQTLYDAAEETLAKTPDMLPVLKQAGVVDSGGRGFVCIAEGMLSFLKTGVVIEGDDKEAPAMATNTRANFEEFDAASIKFAYCTEFIIDKTMGKAVKTDFEALHKYVMSKGDSVVFVDDDEICKIHVHTNHPGHVLEEAMKYGTLCKMKIENMKEQLAREKAESAAQAAAAAEAEKKEIVHAEPTKPFGFVSVAAGAGIQELMLEIGVDNVVTGGQTMNPSTEDILYAVEATPAECVFVFPNNKNIIMAAQMVVPLTEKQIYIIPTKTIPEGISALLAFDEGASAEDNEKIMCEAAGLVKTGQVTHAVRDSEIDGKDIKEGEIMGLFGGTLAAKGSDIEETTLEMAKAMADENTSMITVYFGEDTTEEKALELVDKMQLALGENVSITAISGGQPVYYYIVSAE